MSHHVETSQVICKAIDWFLYGGNIGRRWVIPANIYLFKDNNRNIEKMFKVNKVGLVFSWLILNRFQLFSSVSLVDFEQVNVS